MEDGTGKSQQQSQAADSISAAPLPESVVDATIPEPATKATLPKPATKATRPEATLSEDVLNAPLVHGGLWKAIWVMSWPLLLSTVATSIVGIVDVQVSGYLTSASQAAVGLSEQVIFLFVVFLFSVGVGTTAIVSREFGQGNREPMLTATAQSLILSVFGGLFLTATALAFGKFILPLFTRSPDVVAQASLYLSIFGLYMIPFSVVCIGGAAFRAIGDARTPLFIIVVDVIIHVIGDYLTVLHNWPVPGLGVRGIAVSALTSAVVSALLTVVMLSRSPLKDSLRHLNVFDWELQKRILRIGLPSAVQRLGWAGSVFALFFILSRVPEHTAALASWTIGMRVESVLFMPLMALSLAVSSIVGQNLGAGKEDRAVKAGWNVTFIAVILMLVLASCLFLFAAPISRLMSHDPVTIGFSTSYMRINAFGEPFLAVAMVLMGAMQGAGDTRANMRISLFCNWVVRLPVAWWLAISMNLGTDGVWYAMVSSVIVCAAWCSHRYRLGKWMKVRV
jgi:putative MATE family efflux protein